MALKDLFAWYEYKDGKHPIAMMTIRCHKMADGSEGCTLVNDKWINKAGLHCGYMFGHSGECEMYPGDWEQEEI